MDQVQRNNNTCYICKKSNRNNYVKNDLVLIFELENM